MWHYKGDKFKRKKDYRYIEFNITNLKELELQLESLFQEEGIKKGITITDKSANVKNAESIMEITSYLEKNDIERISFTFVKSLEDFYQTKYIYIGLSSEGISLTVEGIDQVWVVGVFHLIEEFIESRKKTWLKLSKLLRTVSFLSIGSGSFLSVWGVAERDVTLLIISAFLFMTAIIFASRSIVLGLFPYGKFSFQEKKNINWNYVIGIVGILVTILLTILL